MHNDELETAAAAWELAKISFRAAASSVEFLMANARNKDDVHVTLASLTGKSKLEAEQTVKDPVVQGAADYILGICCCLHIRS